jgi:murein DD-endopeptidase MepM/ murein hydrolase activator NlpD
MIAQSPLAILRISVADMVHLRVRAGGLKKDAPPEFLYQRLPPDAMSIMGTLPRGRFAVSIPHQNTLGCGYEIVQTLPQGYGFVIVYARQSNNRYEAVSVLFRNETANIAGFHEQARQWIYEKVGCLEAVPDRYAYFAPDRDHWAVILRDNGYAVLDPSKLPNAVTLQLRNAAKNEPAKFLARVPVHAGAKQSQSSVMPVFSQVEVNPAPHSGGAWISYAQYQRERARRSLPPPGIVSDFLEWLQLLASRCGFERWIFRPGMLFGDKIEWWGDRNRRRTEHEGLDFVEGLHTDETTRSVPETTPVCAMADGNAVAVLDDFLGKTVVMRHPSVTNGRGDVLYTFLSHIRPVSDELGFVAKGRLIGRVNKPEGSIVPAHLHLSGAWIPQAVDPGTVTLDHIHPANTSVALINFNDLIKNGSLCVSSTSSGA